MGDSVLFEKKKEKTHTHMTFIFISRVYFVKSFFLYCFQLFKLVK